MKTKDRIKHKMIRDGLKEDIEKSGRKVTKLEHISDIEYFLARKVVEEAKEIGWEMVTKDRVREIATTLTYDIDSIVEEIADVLEVIDELKVHFAITDDEVEQVKRKKLQEKGGFRNHYVIKV